MKIKVDKTGSKIVALLGRYAGSIRSNRLPINGVVSNYQSTVGDIPEKRKSHSYLGGSLKSRIKLEVQVFISAALSSTSLVHERYSFARFTCFCPVVTFKLLRSAKRGHLDIRLNERKIHY
jgi:hypothetical protein